MQLGQNNGQWVVVEGKEILERFDSKDLAIDYLKIHQEEKHKHEYPDFWDYRICVIRGRDFKGVILSTESGRFCTTCDHWDKKDKDTWAEDHLGWKVEYCLPGCREHDHEKDARRHETDYNAHSLKP